MNESSRAGAAWNRRLEIASVELAASGERALENARRAQAAGSEAVQAELARIQALCEETQALIESGS
jgi:hypothetical protein